MDVSALSSLYRQMAIIREFETRLLTGFSQGELRGTTHTCLGQEAIAVAAMSFVRPGDTVFSNHRGHGHFLAYGGTVEALALELFGHPEGVCKGIGGSQHLHWNDFYSNGVQGGIVPVATGMGLAALLARSRGLSVCFLGDGTLGEGVVYESFNIAALWKLPVLFVVENNRIAQSTPVERNLAGDLSARPRAFGISTQEVDSNDILDILPQMQESFDAIRAGRGPRCVIVHTVRLGPHSKGDDVRSKEEMARLRERDPILLCRRRLGAAVADPLDAEAKVIVGAAMDMARKKRSVHSRVQVEPMLTSQQLPPRPPDPVPGWFSGRSGQRVVEHARASLGDAMGTHPQVLLLGEDILDPYGGAFKVTRGLAERFPGRVLGTPISEAAIVGIANGLALRGWQPIVEIMFGDFLTLAMDQVVNHMTKFPTMYGYESPCPVILRVPMGGYRGYGPTHSQCLEKLLLGVPGLTVTAMSPCHDQRLLLERMIRLRRPVLHVENKMLYAHMLLNQEDGRMGRFHVRSDFGWFPTLFLSLAPPMQPVDVAIVTFGGLSFMALEAAERLFVEDEVNVEVAVCSQLAPLPLDGLLSLARRARILLTLEEGGRTHGWGAEILATLVESGAVGGVRMGRYAALDTVVPSAADQEACVLPSLPGLMERARSLLR